MPAAAVERTTRRDTWWELRELENENETAHNSLLLLLLRILGLLVLLTSTATNTSTTREGSCYVPSSLFHVDVTWSSMFTPRKAWQQRQRECTQKLIIFTDTESRLHCICIVDIRSTGVHGNWHCATTWETYNVSYDRKLYLVHRCSEDRVCLLESRLIDRSLFPEFLRVFDRKRNSFGEDY